MISRRGLIKGLGVALAGLTGLSILKNLNIDGKKAPNPSTSPQYFPNVELTNHLGEKVRFYDDLIKDKFVVINMMYAQCSEGICPISTFNLKKAHEALGDRVGRDIHFYSISLDAYHDTPKVLKKYAEDHQIGNGWQFLTGNYDDIEIIRRKLGFYDHDPVADKDRTAHAGVVRIGSDVYQRWMMAPALGSYTAILSVINHAYRAPKVNA